MRIYPNDLKTFEGFLVREFRAVQALHDLAQEERQALLHADVSRLIELSRRKEGLLNRMEGLESLRARLYESMGWTATGEPLQDLAGALQDYQPADVARLMRLQQGILVLTSQVRELAVGNRSLANWAIQQMTSLSPAGARPEGSPDLPAILSALIGAYDVLNSQEKAAIPAAIEHLNVALEQFGRMLDEAALQAVAAPGNGQALRPVAQDSHKLVEGVTRLYRRQSAYQAVLESSSRMLTSVCQ